MINIRRISTLEVDKLQEISRKTFTETFAESNTGENMKKYLEENLSTERLTSELNNPSSLFYFAEEAEEIIGYLKLNKADAQTDLQDNRSIEIERIYVAKQYQGQKIGQKLFRHAINVAKELKADYVWLGVWEHNTNAINFYQKNGFVEFDRHKFILGDDEQMDILMKLPIDKVQ